MSLHALYDPAHDQLVKDADGKVVTNDRHGLTPADIPDYLFRADDGKVVAADERNPKPANAPKPQGCYWLLVHEEDDTSAIRVFDPRNHQRGTPGEIKIVPPGKALRVTPITRKA
jgi:hypothetical protein